MEQLMQEKICRTRWNLKICYWLIGAGCVMLIVLIVMMFTVDGGISWGIPIGLLLSLMGLFLSAFNNRRILHSKRPWGDF